MNRRRTVLANIAIVVFIVAFVLQYARNEERQVMLAQTEVFENMTVAMEHIATRYLEGEQMICSSWANFVEERHLSMEEALEALKLGTVRPEVMAHLVFLDTMKGLSTHGRAQDPDNHAIDYRAINVLNDLPLGDQAKAGVNITRAFTNPVNGEQSLGFYREVSFYEQEGVREGLLLWVLPIKSFEDGWVFPSEEYSSAQLALIDGEGNYILKGKAFKNSNFFEFYKSYNKTDPQNLRLLQTEVLGGVGTLPMTDSKGDDCLIGYTTVNSKENWTIVTYVRMSDLERQTVDYFLLGCVVAALALLLLIDILAMHSGSVKLKKATYEAEAANRAKTDFLSSMSHDIRTPMNAIVGLTTIASKNVEDPDTVRECLKKIQLASNHLLTLINDILDISKVESGRLSLSPVSFSLVETAENLVNMSLPLVKEKQIDFDFCITHISHEYLFADQLRLNQVFINLLSNAIKYTGPQGLVKVTMEERETEAEGMVQLVYVVKDTGMGMTKEFMQNMYEPFSRQSGSQMNGIQGTGLGLAITRRMVQLMNGTIACESEVGVGTTFTVTLTLPLSEKEENYQVSRPVPVLVVDDDEMLLQTAKETLEEIGARPMIASSGEKALEILKQETAPEDAVEVVILDWKMPEMDGVEVARRIRREVGSEVPILVVSAYDWSEIEEDAKAAGVNSFISKPLFRSTLYGKIHELLGVKTEKAEQEEKVNIAGMNILVAEDNDINWEIISYMMGMYEVKCERAENGLQAVERMERAEDGEFDLIFMDIKMPVMDGLTAARKIRSRERQYLKTIPIIAMTANAFSEDVAACLEAGMNGHIAKPIDMKLVVKEIQNIREEK